MNHRESKRIREVKWGVQNMRKIWVKELYGEIDSETYKIKRTLKHSADDFMTNLNAGEQYREVEKSKIICGVLGEIVAKSTEFQRNSSVYFAS